MTNNITSLPFFDEAHRTLATALAGWARASLAEDHALSVDDQCRALVRHLGDAGWLRYCVPSEYGGALDTLDSRALCILRETLAYHEGLADFAFAMQGLGMGSVSLFATDVQRQWLTQTRAVRGLVGSMIALASSSRPLPT